MSADRFRTITTDMPARRMGPQPLLSIVVPLYNEELVIDALHARLIALMDEAQIRCEVVMVNDGSRDATVEKAKGICRRDERFKLLSFSRNFGHQLAITAGMDKAAGDAIVIIDADLQDRLKRCSRCSRDGARATTWSTASGRSAKGRTYSSA